jgi:hypothetical protein
MGGKYCDRACYMAKVQKLWGAPPDGGASCFYERHILNEIWVQDKIQDLYFGRHFVWLKYFTCHLVPVLAPNYKQHVLLPL